MAPSKQVVLITGCSDSGLSFALAIAFHKASWRIFASTRSISKLKQTQDLGTETLQLDTVVRESITSAVSRIRELASDSLDVLLNNADTTDPLMPTLDVDIAKKPTVSST